MNRTAVMPDINISFISNIFQVKRETIRNNEWKNSNKIRIIESHPFSQFQW